MYSCARVLCVETATADTMSARDGRRPADEEGKKNKNKKLLYADRDPHSRKSKLYANQKKKKTENIFVIRFAPLAFKIYIFIVIHAVTVRSCV